MIATSHVIIGGAIGIATRNPVLGFAAGFASHLLCDCIPHLDAPFNIEYKDGNFDEPVWTKKLFLFALSDSLIAFFLTLFLWFKFFDLSFLSPFAWGALGAYLPDFIDNVPLWCDRVRRLPILKQFHRLHLATHALWRFRFPMPQYWFLGIATQIIFIIPSLWYLLQ